MSQQYVVQQPAVQVQYVPAVQYVTTGPTVQYVAATGPGAAPTQKSSGERFREIAQRYEISNFFASKMRQVEGFEIAIIMDDSGSMNNAVDSSGSNPYETKKTRWDEGKQIAGTIIDIAGIMDPTGVDVYFLNRPPAMGVKSSAELEAAFKPGPSGMTPLCPVLKQVINDKEGVAKERKLLIIIITDGVPTDRDGEPDVKELERILKYGRKPMDKTFITFVACTDVKADVDHLSKFDKEIKNTDCVDDYQSERKEVLARQGSTAKFSFGDYVVKTMIGAVDAQFDNLDEKHTTITPPPKPQAAGGCCIIM
jgi:hypothetical protein